MSNDEARGAVEYARHDRDAWDTFPASWGRPEGNNNEERAAWIKSKLDMPARYAQTLARKADRLHGLARYAELLARR
jgi:hypothetical protein